MEFWICSVTTSMLRMPVVMGGYKKLNVYFRESEVPLKLYVTLYMVAHGADLACSGCWAPVSVTYALLCFIYGERIIYVFIIENVFWSKLNGEF